MQDMFRMDDYLGADLFDRDGLPFVVADIGGGAEVQLLRQQLREARAVAGEGDLRTARTLCAEVVLDHLPELSRDRDLLRAAIAALIHARGFQLLNRLLVAVDGRRVRVALGEPRTAALPPHLIERSDEPGAITFTVSERLFGDPSCEAVVDRWSEQLAYDGARQGALAPI